MQQFPLKLGKRLEMRKENSSYRDISVSRGLIDLSSNDYLGFSGNRVIYDRTLDIQKEHGLQTNGAGGSRLLTGNHPLYPLAESVVAGFHGAKSALIFNSGYDANVGFFSCVPGRGDMVLYDEYIHASIRDGIGMSRAKAYKFRHNDLEDLREKIVRLKSGIPGEVYVVTESIFSMDGDRPDLKKLTKFAKELGCYVIVDEAHAVGVLGRRGEGLVSAMGLNDQVFARIITFGKALGGHGAAVLGSARLREYLINFSRSLIYSTALPPHSVAAILAAYEHLGIEMSKGGNAELKKLGQLISFFRSETERLSIDHLFIDSSSAIQSCVISGNERVKEVARRLKEQGYGVKPVLSPTVPLGSERLRFCLHSYNSEKEISGGLQLLGTFVE